jgi:hypothetical protein
MSTRFCRVDERHHLDRLGAATLQRMGRLTRRLKVPMFTRTVNLTVNIRESPGPTAPAPVHEQPKPTGGSRIWIIARTTGPIVASVLAIVISILAYTEQRSADQFQTADSQQQEAAEVSAIQIGNTFVSGYSSNVSAKVENLGTNTIINPTLAVGVGAFNGAKINNGSQGDVLAAVYLILPDIPACGSTTISLSREVQRYLASSKPPPFTEVQPAEIYLQSTNFTDGGGLNWSRSDYGGLQQIASVLPSDDNYALTVDAAYKPLSGCG